MNQLGKKARVYVRRTMNRFWLFIHFFFFFICVRVRQGTWKMIARLCDEVSPNFKGKWQDRLSSVEWVSSFVLCRAFVFRSTLYFGVCISQINIHNIASAKNSERRVNMMRMWCDVTAVGKRASGDLLCITLSVVRKLLKCHDNESERAMQMQVSIIWTLVCACVSECVTHFKREMHCHPTLMHFAHKQCDAIRWWSCVNGFPPEISHTH